MADIGEIVKDIRVGDAIFIRPKKPSKSDIRGHVSSKSPNHLRLTKTMVPSGLNQRVQNLVFQMRKQKYDSFGSVWIARPIVDEVVRELADTDIYSHLLVGSFRDINGGGTGIECHEVAGPDVEKLKKISVKEYIFRKLFDDPKKTYAENQPEFKGRYFCNKREGGDYLISFMYCDRQLDTRYNSFVEHSMWIPESEAERMIPLILGNSDKVFVDLFQKMFRKYDRSKGALEMDNQGSKVCQSAFDLRQKYIKKDKSQSI